MNRRRLFVAATLGALLFVPLALAPLDARAADSPLAPATSAISASPGVPATSNAASSVGLAVVALPGAGAAAWTLAQSIYATDALRPTSLDEAHARVLAGEPAPPGASRDLVDLAETRGAVRGDDAPSRAILTSIANTFHLRGIVVVEMGTAAHPSARVFVASAGGAQAPSSQATGVFDAARYEPDAVLSGSGPSGSGPSGSGPSDSGASDTVRWTGATTSLARAFAIAPPMSAPALATSSVPDAPRETEKKGSAPFFKSPWFWGAVGAAAFGTTAIYFATRDNSSSTIHLEMQAPK